MKTYRITYIDLTTCPPWTREQREREDVDAETAEDAIDIFTSEHTDTESGEYLLLPVGIRRLRQYQDE